MRGPLSFAAAAVLASLAAASPAAADDASGRWAVAGHAGGKDFTLNCTFAQAGQALSGACVDGPTGDARVKGGRSHTLTKGTVTGNNVSWTYRSNYGIIGFNVDYAGVRQGDRMSGKITSPAAGTFTANRAAP
ncbi:MAG TPA: hypothetical protein VKQ54_02065 [Caulobacteraceae bacterium]|nr:hypothetical protein [Caulobacteraceae bacterium]